MAAALSASRPRCVGCMPSNPSSGAFPPGRAIMDGTCSTTKGPITRSVRDAAAMLDIMAGPDQLFLGQIVPRLLVQFEQELPANFQEQLDPAAVSLLKLGIAMSARDAYAAVYGD